jgi:glycosyltransferase involved in cell wall biosynthesis
LDERERHERLAELAALRVWLVVPMFRVRDHILGVLGGVPPWVEGVVAVDDACPEESGALVAANCLDPRVRVVHHQVNQGVGGAVLTGYRHAIAAGARIIVKVDGDGQMDLRQLPALVLPIASGRADYTKGTRFSSRSHIGGMPVMRVVGNSILSMMSKVSTGYWNIFDPTNGYCAIEARVAAIIVERNVARRYFFESDMLYHLGALRAVVQDVPMPAIYANETSNLNIRKIVLPFLGRHIRNTLKRFVGSYLVRDFSVASLEFILGILLIGFGLTYAGVYLAFREAAEEAASAGIVMGVALPIILGLQLLLAGINYDVLNVPKEPIYPALRAADQYSDLVPQAEGSGSQVSQADDLRIRPRSVADSRP